MTAASPWWAPARPRRPPPAPAGAQRDRGRAPRLVRARATSSRSRRPPCRSRPATRRICTPSPPRRSGPTAIARAALPAHLAGIRLQEAAGGRRAADLQLRPGLPQPRARRRCTIPNSPCSNGIATGETYESADGRLRGAAGARRRDRRRRRRFAFRGREADPFAEPERLTVAEAFARHAGIDLLATVAADGATDRDALHAAVDGRRHARRRRTTPGPTSSAASWSSGSSRNLGDGPRDDPLRIPDRRRRRWPAPARAIRASPSASSSMPAASNSPTPSAN